jgi:heme/copper-type cytochrome/quinol oxidase subunit 4
MIRTRLPERLWLIVFSSLFSIRLLRRVVSELPERASTSWNVNYDYGITEWMINYQGGFVRRGLPGNLLHGLYGWTGIGPDVAAIVISLSCFILLFVYLLPRAAGILPTWVLLTTPLLGFMVYMNDTLVRKDGFLLLLLAIVMRSLFVEKWNWRDVLIILVLPCIGVLSHEIFAFLCLPAAFLILGLNWRSDPVRIQESLIKAFCLLPSVVGTLAVASHRGSLLQAIKINSSWQSFLVKHPNPDHLGGSIEWLQFNSGHGAAIVNSMWKHVVIKSKYFSISYGVMIILLTIAALLLIANAFHRPDFGMVFLVFGVIQIVAMLPVFLHALDQGRWVAMSLTSALIIALEFDKRSRQVCVNLFSFFCVRTPSAHRRLLIISLLCPIGLGFWGLPHAGWSNWFVTSPFGSVLSPLGVPGPFRALETLLRYI